MVLFSIELGEEEEEEPTKCIKWYQPEEEEEKENEYLMEAIDMEIKEEIEEEIDGKVEYLKGKYVDFLGVAKFDCNVINYLFKSMDVAKSQVSFMKM